MHIIIQLSGLFLPVFRSYLILYLWDQIFLKNLISIQIILNNVNLFFYIIYHTKRDTKRVGTLNYNFISCFCFISISATRENVQLIFLIIQGIAAWQHPVIVLKDVPFSHLQGIVEFIYHGEVSIDQVSHFVCCSISWYIWVL
jgi:hypothetical protein